MLYKHVETYYITYFALAKEERFYEALSYFSNRFFIILARALSSRSTQLAQVLLQSDNEARLHLLHATWLGAPPAIPNSTLWCQAETQNWNVASSDKVLSKPIEIKRRQNFAWLYLMMHSPTAIADTVEGCTWVLSEGSFCAWGLRLDKESLCA